MNMAGYHTGNRYSNMVRLLMCFGICSHKIVDQIKQFIYTETQRHNSLCHSV
jgi:hypothetical protein